VDAGKIPPSRVQAYTATAPRISPETATATGRGNGDCLVEVSLLGPIEFTMHITRGRALGRIVIILAVALCALAAPDAVRAQSTAAGRRFLVAFPDTIRNLPMRRVEYFTEPTFYDVASMILFSEDTARVRLRGPRVVIDTVVVPGRSTVIRLDSLQRVFVTTLFGQPSRDLYEITADRDVSLTCYFATTYGAEAFSPLPVEQWGTTHAVVSLPPDSVLHVMTYITQEEDQYGARRSPEQVVVIAALDGTRITFEPEDTLELVPRTTISLDAGEAMQHKFDGWSRPYRPSLGMVGTRITSNKPIGVLSGNARVATGDLPVAPVTRNSIKNPLVEWVRPTAMRGRSFAYRSFGDIAGARTGERLRIIATGPGSTTVTTTAGPWGDRVMRQGSVTDLYLTENDTFDLRSFEIRASGPIEVVAVSGAWTGLGKLSTDPDFPPEILAWSPAMTTLTPHDAWFDRSRFHAPVYPVQLQHNLTIVADAAAELTLDDVPITTMTRVFGSSMQCITMPIAPGDHVVRSRRGRFSGTVSGRARGWEAFRPMGVRPGGGSLDGSNAPAHVATYAENIAVSYAYPLTGTPMPPDSFAVDTARACDSLLVAARTVGLSLIDSSRYQVTIGDSSNVIVRRDSILDGDLHVGWRVVVRPARTDADARAIVTVVDAFGTRRTFVFTYTAAPLAVAPSRVELFSIPVGVVRSTTVTITNRTDVPITIAAIDLANGSSGFALPDAPLRDITLAAGGDYAQRVTFVGTEYDSVHRDTILLRGDCLDERIPLMARTTDVVPKPLPVIEGYDWRERWLSSRNACTKNDTVQYTGVVRLQNEGDRAFTVSSAELLESDGGAFALDTSLAAETIRAGESLEPDENGVRSRVQRVVFAPVEERAHRGVYRVITDGGDTLDAVLSGIGIESHIAVDPVALDLGSLVLDSPGDELARASVTISARPTRPLTVRELRLDGSAAIRIDRAGGFVPPDPTDPATWWRLMPGESRVVPIVFAPLDTGFATARLSASGDHARCDDSVAAITAHAYRIEVDVDVALTPTFGCAPGDGRLSVVNRSPVGVMLASVAIVPTGTFVQEPPVPLPARIEAGATLDLPLRFLPPAPGVHAATAELVVRDSSGGGLERRISVALASTTESIALRARIDSTHGLPGEHVTASVWMDDGDGIDESLALAAITELEIAVSCDARVLRLLGSSTDGGALDGWAQTVLEQSDTLYRVRLTGPRALATSGRLLTLLLRGHLGPVVTSPLALTVTPSTERCVDVASSPGLFRLDSICGMSLRMITLLEEGYALREARPSPTTGSTTIAFSIPVNAPLRIELLNASGARVALLVDGSMGPGSFEVTWDASGVASGVYYCRMRSADVEIVRGIVVAR